METEEQEQPLLESIASDSGYPEHVLFANQLAKLFTGAFLFASPGLLEKGGGNLWPFCAAGAVVIFDACLGPVIRNGIQERKNIHNNITKGE